MACYREGQPPVYLVPKAADRKLALGWYDERFHAVEGPYGQYNTKGEPSAEGGY